MLINATGNPVTVKQKINGRTLNVVLEDSKLNVRVTHEKTYIDYLDRVPVIKKQSGVIKGLPNPTLGVYYIVTYPVAVAAKASGRTDCYIMAEKSSSKELGHCLLQL